MDPRRDQIWRTEKSLQIWMLEVKGVAAKRKYFCEICLDKILFARTSTKPRDDICFWGERFEFCHLTNVNVVCINLYRDADPKKKKDRSTLIGFVQIPIDQLFVRYPVERWYTITIGIERTSALTKNETPSIRIKARYQITNILPLHCYDQLLKLICYNYLPLCLALEPVLSVKAKEEFATSIVRVLHKQMLATDFLCDLIMTEVDALDNEHLMFRGNSLATKAMEAYMKLVADDYLHETLGDFIRGVLDSDGDNCEVDPLKVGTHNHQLVLETNRRLLTFYVEGVWARIINSTHRFPVELQQIFDTLRRRLTAARRADLIDNLISSSIFLRFFCPAILSPSLFNLASEYPSARASRNLTLIAKTLQTLANFTKFGGKEHYMEFMNQFVTREWINMRQYLLKISSSSNNNIKLKNGALTTAALPVDYGKELALLHEYLNESWTENIQQQTDEKLATLIYIIGEISTMLQRRQTMSNESSRSVVGAFGSSSSDYDDVNRFRPLPAHHLDTSDDYVVGSALLLNESLAMRQAGMCVQQHRTAPRNRQVGITRSNDLYSKENTPAVGASSSVNTGFLNAAFQASPALTTRSEVNSRTASQRTSNASTDIDNKLLGGGGGAGFQRPRHRRPATTSITLLSALMGSQTQRVVDIITDSNNGGGSLRSVAGNGSYRASPRPLERSETLMQQPSSGRPLAIANPLYNKYGGGDGLPRFKYMIPANSLPDISPSSTTRGDVGGGDGANGDISNFSFSSLPINKSTTPPSTAVPQKSIMPTKLFTSLDSNGDRVIPRTNPRIWSIRAPMRSADSDGEECDDDDSGASSVMRNGTHTQQWSSASVKDDDHSISLDINSSSHNDANSLKPIMDRLRMVENELHAEMHSGQRKQEIIDAQQRKINALLTANQKLIDSLAHVNDEHRKLSETCAPISDAVERSTSIADLNSVMTSNESSFESAVGSTTATATGFDTNANRTTEC